MYLLLPKIMNQDIYSILGQNVLQLIDYNIHAIKPTRNQFHFLLPTLHFRLRINNIKKRNIVL